jgi:hypothetical protein
MKFRDAEKVSAYLDGQLEADEARRFEALLAVSPELRKVLDDLRLTRHVLKRTPKRRAPRNFSLQPRNTRVRGPEPRSAPVLRLASVLACMLFLASIAVNGLAPTARRLTAARAPAYGLGGGAGGGGPAVTEQPLQSFAAAPQAGTTAPEAPAPEADGLGAQALTPQAAAKAAPPAAAEPARNAGGLTAIPVAWEWILGLAALGLAGAAWYAPWSAARTYRRRWLDK